MDFKEIFKGISKKLYSDFEISSQISHGTDKGSFREDSLKKFLEEGKLPKKYTIGHGQVISRKNEVSKSVDLVIYDSIESSPLLYNDATQIFPIESIYGIIECKSKLSKEKLIEGLDNIKSVKAIAPRDHAYKKSGLMTMSYSRPTPFGIIFAYSLGGNSLQSLTTNLIEWEKNNDSKVWPNMVVVLNEGIIIHRNNSLDDLTYNNDITDECRPWAVEIKENSLFKFYLVLMDLCASMQLGGFRLEEYFNLPENFGDLFVKGNDKFTNSKNGKRTRVKLDFLREVNEYCDDSKKSTYVEVFKKMTGSFINGMNEELYSRVPSYLYNPNNYPGMHEVEPSYSMVNGRPVFIDNLCFPFYEFDINDKHVFIPFTYLKDDKWEEID